MTLLSVRAPGLMVRRSCPVDLNIWRGRGRTGEAGVCVCGGGMVIDSNLYQSVSQLNIIELLYVPALGIW